MKRKKIARFHYRRWLMAAALVLALLTAGSSATFAWFTATDGKQNHFQTGRITDGTATLYELFREPKEWVPGQEVIKNVGVANVGELPVLARISFEEILDKFTSVYSAKNHVLTGTEVPIVFTNDAIYTTANGWYTPASLPAANGGPLAIDSTVTAGLGAAAASTLLVRGQRLSATSNNYGYNFVFWYVVPSGPYAGKKQAARADFYVEDVSGVLTLKMAPGSQKFYAYDGRAKTEAMWANFPATLKHTSAAVTTPSLPLTANTVRSVLDSKIKLAYDELTATPTSKKWVYNPDDGYFYYIGLIPPGSISPLLLKSVTLDATADDSYGEMKFDLYVVMQAIQPTKDALTSPIGWGMNGASPASAAIIAKLQADGCFQF
ncbi:MAG: SipW-dependent-type signal peptide-containing protein [Oscillospiraceae bacterium]|jgi:predicted ribosomally synthesized peptide with SipW-like signal peptide|nr:SipW-dependent-type signal peptide-containing protein [Oscillospiraceae bacterium]